MNQDLLFITYHICAITVNGCHANLNLSFLDVSTIIIISLVKCASAQVASQYEATAYS